MTSPSDTLAARLRVLQIIAFALMSGSAFFLAVVVYLVQQNGGRGQSQLDPAAMPIISYVAALVLVMEAPLAFFIPRILEQAGLNRLAAVPRDGLVLPPNPRGPSGPITDQGYLLNLYQTSMIIGMALFEGASFFGSIAYLLEARPFALAIAAAPIALIALRFPTHDRLTAWLRQRSAELDNRRMRRG